MAGSVLVAANVFILIVVIALSALTTYISISMLWSDLKRALRPHHTKKEYTYLDMPTPQDA